MNAERDDSATPFTTTTTLKPGILEEQFELSLASHLASRAPGGTQVGVPFTEANTPAAVLAELRRGGLES